MVLLASILAGALPMLAYAWFLYRLDRWEREPLPLLAGVFSWGALIAAGAAFLVNTASSAGIYLLTGSEFATQLTLSTLIAPAVEETLKGAAVLIVFLLYPKEFNSPLDGLVYAGITALGFAATENIWYIYQLGFLNDGWQGLLDLTLIRGLLVGWQHPFYTGFIGLGFALARRCRHTPWIAAAPLAGWSFAVGFHLLHNLLATLVNGTRGMVLAAIWDWSGYLGLFALILLFIGREQRWMKSYLAQELHQGIISAEHYRTACSAWRQTAALIRARSRGAQRQARDFYQACGELMHKKRQLLSDSDQPEEALEIQRLRSALTRLADSAF